MEHARNCHLRVQGKVPRYFGRGAQDAQSDPCNPLRQTGCRSDTALRGEALRNLAGLHGGNCGDPRGHNRSYWEPRSVGSLARMKYLLDTHIWLWGSFQPDRLSRRVTKILADPQNELWLSPVSIWELTILCRKGFSESIPTSAAGSPKISHGLGFGKRHSRLKWRSHFPQGASCMEILLINFWQRRQKCST